MSADASPAASSPMTTDLAVEGSHREVDASTPLTNATSASEHMSSSSSLHEVCADLDARVQNFLSVSPKDDVTRRTQEQTRISLQVAEQALQKYDFIAGEISLSYNGGKDCLVLLILYLAALHRHFSSTSTTSREFPSSIPSIYAKPPDPFAAVSAFVESSSRDYHLDLTHISTSPVLKKTRTNSSTQETPVAQSPPTTQDPRTDDSSKVVTFRDAFAQYLASNPSIRAIFVGTRRTDPHGKYLSHFDMTDGNWPRFMRIHPVIDWHLDEIWCFLRAPQLADPKTGARLQYCAMYDQGYTSLGGVEDTLQNPKLKYTDSEGVSQFRPAYALTEDSEERLGRE